MVTSEHKPATRSPPSHHLAPRAPIPLKPPLQRQLVELRYNSYPSRRTRQTANRPVPLPAPLHFPPAAAAHLIDAGQGGFEADEDADSRAHGHLDAQTQQPEAPSVRELPSTSVREDNNIGLDAAEHQTPQRKTLTRDSPIHVQSPQIVIVPSSYEGMLDTNTVTAAESRAAGSLLVSDHPTSSSLATPSPTHRGGIGYGSSHVGPGGSTTSLGDLSSYSTSLPVESPGMASTHTGPRSSILLNPSNKKTFVDAWRALDGSGPAVLQIAAVPTARDRELEKERERIEREKEIERELKEREQAEKVWGIPKKAFYMGLGDINFNTQMAILGGWGNGSGPATDFRPTVPSNPPRRPSSSGGRPSSSGGRPSSSAGREKSKRDKDRQQGLEREQADRKRREKETEKEKEKEGGGESDDSMDLEELASLNAIINTRRSMEAAQALTSGQHKMTVARKSVSHASLEDSLPARPSLNPPIDSNESERVATPSSEGNYANGSPASFGHKTAHSQTSSEIFKQQSHIRFAPLPQAYGGTSLDGPRGETYALGLDRTRTDSMENLGVEKAPTESDRLAHDESDSSEENDSDDGDESRSRRIGGLSGSKSKW